MLTKMWTKWNSDTLLAGWSINRFNCFGKLVVSVNPNTNATPNPEILLLGIYPTEVSAYIYKKTYTTIIISVLFIKAAKEKTTCPSIID